MSVRFLFKTETQILRDRGGADNFPEFRQRMDSFPFDSKIQVALKYRIINGAPTRTVPDQIGFAAVMDDDDKEAPDSFRKQDSILPLETRQV